MYQLYHAFTSLLQVFQPIRLGVSNSPLITAVLAKQTETVRHLLVGGADTSAMDDLDHNALHYAAMGGYEEILLLLLCNGANINARNGTGSNLTALAIAVASDEEVVGKILIGRGATIAPDSLSAFGMETHDRWIAEVSVAQDASGQDIDVAPPHQPPIAPGQLSRAWASLLGVFQSAAPVGHRPPPGFVTPPLITAVLRQKTETVRQLLASGADTSAMDDVDHNALHYAAMGGYEEIVLLLLHNGAKINARNGTGSELTALDMAIASGEEMVARILISRGATPGGHSPTDDVLENYNLLLA